MTLKPEEIDEVRQKVIEMFGDDAIKEIDIRYMDLHEIRIASTHNYDFLEKVKEAHPDGADTNTLIAAILYGIKLGEIGREYAYEMEQRERERMLGIGREYQ